MTRRGRAARLCGTALLLATQARGGGGPVFEEVAASVGLVQPHHAVYFITGQAWGDYDRDGRLDAYLTDSQGASTLFRNVGGAFEVAPEAATVALPTMTSGGANFVDFDGDGDGDLLVVGEDGIALFENRGPAGFLEVPGAAGIGCGRGESTAWGDYDGDGDLDVYVVDWFYHGDESSPEARDGFFRNDGGTFTEVTVSLLDDARTHGPGFAASFLDYDNDGDLDLYVVNDKHWGNVLWRNDGPGCAGWCFTDVSLASGAHRPAWSMGIATGDYDNDGDLDLYYSSIGEAVLLQNQTAQGSPTFVEVGTAAGVNPPLIGWGTAFFDYDNDGWLDLFLSVMSAGGPDGNRLYHNLGDGTFEDVSVASGVSIPGPTIGMAAGDFDGDGQVDLVAGYWGDQYRLFRNNGSAGAGRHWLSVALEQSAPMPTHAEGARVTVERSDGLDLMQEVKNGSSIGAGESLDLHFGLGAATADRIRVRWPDGVEEVYEAPPIDQRLRVRRGVGPLLFADDFEPGHFRRWAAAVP